jgi:Methyltransferase domain
MRVVGDLYPGASILGMDLSPIQPEWVPPSVKFKVDDVESSWLRPLNHFDYVHGRHLVTAIKNWPQLLGRVFEYVLPHCPSLYQDLSKSRHLKPGGWLELQEIHHRPQCHDGSMPPGHPVAQYWDLVISGLSSLGVDLNATLFLADMMHEAGFINIETRIFHVPIGTWPKNKVLKTVGLYWSTILIDGLSPIALGPYTRGLGWSKEQVDIWLMTVRKAYLESGGVHSHMPLYIVCGQKPGLGSPTTCLP